MKLKVLKYHPHPEGDYHDCEDEQGNHRRVDIMVDGAFPGLHPDSLVGKTIECRYISTFIGIAQGVRPLNDTTQSVDVRELTGQERSAAERNGEPT